MDEKVGKRIAFGIGTRLIMKVVGDSAMLLTETFAKNANSGCIAFLKTDNDRSCSFLRSLLKCAEFVRRQAGRFLDEKVFPGRNNTLGECPTSSAACPSHSRKTMYSMTTSSSAKR